LDFPSVLFFGTNITGADRGELLSLITPFLAYLELGFPFLLLKQMVPYIELSLWVAHPL
jgi:hypothetical protein